MRCRLKWKEAEKGKEAALRRKGEATEVYLPIPIASSLAK